MIKRTFEYYCDNIENVENYEAAKVDDFKGWDCHHRLETHNSDGERRSVDLTWLELIALDMYWHRPPEELIFLKTNEHMSLHHKGKKRPSRSEEYRMKLSASLKGKSHSDEHKKKISAACKGRQAWNKGKNHSEETKRKISEARKGKHWKLVDGKRVWY